MSTSDRHIGGDATAVRADYGFDEAVLAAWLTANVTGFTGPLTIHRFEGGQSNPTYRLATPGRSYVLRRRPLGPILKGAHAVDREARVLAALGATGFPVPHVYASCTDERVIGTPFYIMEMVDGRIFWDATLPTIATPGRRACFDSMNATIAALHRIDPVAVGLGGYGRPDGYVRRQIERWSRQYLDDEAAGRDANMDRLIKWLAANAPDRDETAIVHGDFRIDNLVFHPTEPRVLAVLDWELSTLGHPVADFAYHASMYHMPPHIVAGLAGADPTALGLPSESEYVAAYCANAGRAALPDYGFHLAFALFRVAAIFHGIKGRVLRGTAASASAAVRAACFPELAAIAWKLARRG